MYTCKQPDSAFTSGSKIPIGGAGAGGGGMRAFESCADLALEALRGTGIGRGRGGMVLQVQVV